jgi:hypothetical protein
MKNEKQIRKKISNLTERGKFVVQLSDRDKKKRGSALSPYDFEEHHISGGIKALKWVLSNDN